jgi:hypothetical protein
MRIRTSLAAAASCLAVAAIIPGAASAHGTHLKAKMSGDQVVGQSGAPNGTGRANLHVLKNKERLCYEVQWDKIGNKTGLNIGVYTGKAGKNGNEVVSLVDSKQNDPVSGCVDEVPKSDLKQISKHPENYHVNVKNKKYPKDGAIRGQLKAV